MADFDVRHPILNADSDTEDRLLSPTAFRPSLNGRSGTSDKDGSGTVEGIRGNTLVASTIGIVEQVIGSCPDVKNNAIISFVYNPLYNLTFSSASITSLFPPEITIVSPSFPLYIGTVFTVGQSGPNIFTGKVFAIVGNVYEFSIVSGTPNSNPVTNIVIPNFHYIKRYFVDTQVTEFLTNPALMGSVLNFQPNDRIINPRIIEAGFTQMLAWVTTPDGVPRLMDIDKMKQT